MCLYSSIVNFFGFDFVGINDAVVSLSLSLSLSSSSDGGLATLSYSRQEAYQKEVWTGLLSLVDACQEIALVGVP
jgi:hypothetical protein